MLADKDRIFTNLYGVHADIAPVLHRADPSLPDHGPCADTLHVVSFSVVGPPTGAEN